MTSERTAGHSRHYDRSAWTVPNFVYFRHFAVEIGDRQCGQLVHAKAALLPGLRHLPK
jgi:hypothetical protein